jgi:hypothetical protein
MKSQTITFVKVGRQLVPLNPSDGLLLEQFTLQVEEGTRVELYLTQLENEQEKTLGQLAKVHADCRELSRVTGHTLTEIKDMVKEKAGLYLVTGAGLKQLKSFAVCSKEELGLAIETCGEIGQLLGYPLP